MLGTLPHILLTILEGAIARNPTFKEKYERVRAKYLEDQVEILVRKHFPHAQVYRGSKWKDPATRKEYENDLVVLIDTFILVVECKSGIVDSPARRGAPDNLKEVLEKLIVEPGEQANRFIAYLRRHVGEHRFETEGRGSNVFCNAGIAYYIPLGITFENLGLLSGNLRQAMEAGFISKDFSSLSPSMCFTDLEAIFELLELEVEKIHYLARRREFEKHVQYVADELDLLGFYLDTGFNIGKEEYAADLWMMLLMKSKELDPYFMGTAEGIPVRKPQLAMTKWWRDILVALSERRPSHWVETGFMLLSTTKEDQTEFEKSFNKLRSKVVAGKAPHKHNWVIFRSGPDQRRFLIVGYPYGQTDRQERNAMINGILSSKEAEETRGAVCIGVDVEGDVYPYSVLATAESSDLLEMK